MGEEYRGNLKQQMQVEAQRLRYEDELAKQRMNVLNLPPSTLVLIPVVH